MKPSDIIDAFAWTVPDLAPRLRELKVSWPSSPNLTGQFFYPAFRSSKPTIEELVELAHRRIIKFAIPASRIAQVTEEINKGIDPSEAWVKLTTEARDLFIKTYEETGRSGEFGELLLYMLVEWKLSAPLVACKMYLKTSLQMPVHGTDGVYLGSNGESMILYWGESKLYEDLPKAISSIADSVADHTAGPTSRENEIRIINQGLESLNLGDEARSALKEYFNPYSEYSNKIQDIYACLAGFDSNIYQLVEAEKAEECEAKFEKFYQDRVISAHGLVAKKLKEANLTSSSFIFFLMPFPSVDAAREMFQNKLWGRK